MQKGSARSSMQPWLELFQTRLHACERGIDLRAQALDHGDNRHRDACGDQAVLNCCSGAFIANELNHFALHSG